MFHQLRRYVIACAGVFVAVLVLATCSRPTENAQPTNNAQRAGETRTKELRVLAWVGYEEDEIVTPFEREFGVKVLTETFVGGDRMFAKLTQAPDAYDVVVIDPEYIAKLHSRGLLTELDPSQFDFADYIDPLKDFPLCRIDGKLYAVLIRFGINALVYNTEKLTAADVASYDILWSPKVKGKVGIWDWYLPNMGVFSLAAGNQDPYRLDQRQLDTLNARLQSLRPQVRGVMGSFSDINGALTRGDIWVVPALGEHTAAVLAEQGYPIAWTVPKQGGIMWIETLGIPPKARNREMALNYMKYMQRPDVQAKLTWRRAYRSNIPSAKGIELLTQKQKELLQVRTPQDAARLVESAHVRRLPEDRNGVSTEDLWQSAWQRFKAQ